jgi:hypothetical protein
MIKCISSIDVIGGDKNLIGILLREMPNEKKNLEGISLFTSSHFLYSFVLTEQYFCLF